MGEATKEEVQKLLVQLQPAPKSRFSALFLKIGAGYAAMAGFTTAALLYSVFNLYAINRTARQIANTDLPVATALIKMRSSLLAQESFAGKYTIFKDATFIDLFRQRKEDSIANLEVLERTNSVGNIASLKRLYLDYQMASERLFAGKSRNREELHTSALRLITVLDALYVERQGVLQTVLKRADEQQKSTIRWAIGVSCAGFLLAIFIATFTQMNQDVLPLTRLPGNLAIERVLNERLTSGTPFSFCHVELDNFQPFLAQYGYAKAGELLHRTGVLIHSAVTGNGAAKDFAGHAGGDCFVMVVSTGMVAPVCEAVVKGFDAEVIKHLNPEDREAGGIQRCDRCGVQRFFPITTVSISVLDCGIDEYASAVEIARAAVNVKDFLKKAPGSGWDRAI